MVADGDSSNVREGCSALPVDLEKAEIGSPATDVNDYEMTGAALRELGPNLRRCAMLLEPPVKCGLRFFQQADVSGKASFACGVHGKPLGDSIEGRRNSDAISLGVERGSSTGNLRSRRGAQVLDQRRARRERRNPLSPRDLARSPGQKGRVATPRMMAEPCF